MNLFVRVRALGLIAALSSLAACATTPGSSAEALKDPWEKTNRSIYAFNRDLDKAIILPVTKVYRATVPVAAQRGIGSSLVNVKEPYSFVNALLQGKVAQAFRIVDRFAINTVLGVGGLADHATDMGRPAEVEDIGQTLAVWGVKSGPYIMLPFYGPSTIRDGAAFVAERFVEPYRIAIGRANLTTPEFIGLTGTEILDARSFLIDTTDGLLNGSADEYATVRSAYLQFREGLIYDGTPPEEEVEPLPEFTESVESASETAPQD